LPFSFLDPLFNMASLKGLILIALAIIQVVQCTTPTIGFISPDLVADIGGTVELVCTVKNGNEYPILWMKLEDERKNNPVPISTGNKLFFKNSRYSLEFDPNAGSYKLIINDVAKSDEGKYQCQVVTTPENVITADVDVKVKTTPVMKEDAEPVVMQEVGKTAEMECEAAGYPDPKISWVRQDGKLLPSGQETLVSGKLTIPNVQRNNRGKYICTANNDVGTAKERILNLVVGFPPTIELPRPRVPQAAYYEAHLECHIRAYPSTTINWKRNETVLENDGNHFISHYADSDDLVISTMKIYSVYEEDFGKYTCEAGNKYGKDTQHLELYESSIPICPPLCGDTDLNSGANAAKDMGRLTFIIGTVAFAVFQRLMMI